MSAAAPPVALRRDPQQRVLAGVCAGFARRFGLDPLLVRLGLVAITVFTGGFGVVLYVLAWAFVPAGEGPAVAFRLRAGRGSWRTAAGVGLLALSVLLTFRELGVWWSDALVWPLVLAAAGAALLWRYQAERDALPDAAEAVVRRRATAAGIYRGGFGIALVVGAGLLFLYANGALGAARDAALAALVVVIGLGLILAPFWWRVGRNLAAERAERIRSQERAEVAAHLHDSVLQTLALVQKRADEPRQVAALARRQERELRAWLSGRPRPLPDESLTAALQAAAAEVEEAHGVPIEVVGVGDCPLDERAEALVAAAREALVNAAKFAGDAGAVAVYSEVEDERVQVFVHDRGPGFDPGAVPPDRRGVRESIVGRMERHGGRAELRSVAGGGTEVELTMERRAP